MTLQESRTLNKQRIYGQWTFPDRTPRAIRECRSFRGSMTVVELLYS